MATSSSFFLAIVVILISCFDLGDSVSPAILAPVVLQERKTVGSCPSDELFSNGRETLQEDIDHTLHSSLIAAGVFCPCGGPGQWTRIAHLNMSDTSEKCPLTFAPITTPVRGCGRTTFDARTCDSITFPTKSISYSRVCGRVNAYQRGTPNAFEASIDRNPGLEGAYIDGVSLTHGAAGSRQHIWSFAAAVYEDASNYRPDWACSCTKNTANWPFTVPSFVGDNYFCATANPDGIITGTAIFSDDPLWDGKGCGSTNACCEFNNPPWFCTTLPQPITDDIELRICHDQNADNEDVIISSIDIYIK